MAKTRKDSRLLSIPLTGKHVRLRDLPTEADPGMDRDSAHQLTADLIKEAGELQELMYATRRHSLLVVLQGRDAAGKDGTIRKVLGQLNAQSCSVIPFSAPSERELRHDFLWRVHANAPEAGLIRVFNRSHYEDVVAVRVRKLAPEEVWRRRYAHINAFEELLLDSQTLVLKLFLHISKGEQKRRLTERLSDPLKGWKYSAEDWKDRALWQEYDKAYEGVFRHCASERAPWHVIPADSKWVRNLAVARLLRDTLKPHREEWTRALRRIRHAADSASHG